MPLVAYPDSDDDSSHVPPANAPASVSTSVKRVRAIPALDCPPLPAAIHDLYATNVRTATKDDPSLHGGRKRQITHVEGHWPTHVYLEWHPTASETQLLQNMITPLVKSSSKVHSLLQSDLGVPLPLHISLSRTLSLQTSDREAFLAQLKSSLSHAGVSDFGIRFSGLAWYSNYERNRWFLSLGAAKPNGNELNRLLQASNKVCHATQQPELYAPTQVNSKSNNLQSKNQRLESVEPSSDDARPGCADPPDCSDSFHVSLAWSLELQVLSSEDEQAALKEIDAISVDFNCIKVKIGNSITSISLKVERSPQ